MPPPSPWPTPTAPTVLAPPVALPTTSTDQPETRAVAEAQAALDALTTAQAAARANLLAAQWRDLANAQQALASARQQRDLLKPRHARDLVERQNAARQALQVLRDAQAALKLAKGPAEIQRATERVHAAEAKLRAAADALDRVRAEQEVEHSQADAAVAKAQANFEALPEQQRQALAKLDADQRAALILATSKVESARSRVADAQQAQQRTAALAAATGTAQVMRWQGNATATIQAHQMASTATAQAQPTPAPSAVVSRASGRVLNIRAEEKDGRLVVTLEVAP